MKKWITEMRDWATFFNKHLSDTRYSVVDKSLFPIVKSKSGELYKIHTDLCTYNEAYTQYNHKDIQMNDIVLDIGANIGAFSLLAAKKCRWVHAYEPVLFDVLRENIALNAANNIVPHKIALGNGQDVNITWQGKIVTVPSMRLTQMISDIGGHCDFLKCDGEGSEWEINPSELKDIHRIEIEFHQYSKHNHKIIDDIATFFHFTTKYDAKHDTFWISGVNRNV